MRGKIRMLSWYSHESINLEFWFMAALFRIIQFIISVIICLWKPALKNHIYSENRYNKRKYYAEKFSVLFVCNFQRCWCLTRWERFKNWISHNNSIGLQSYLNFQCDYNRWNVSFECLKIWNGILVWIKQCGMLTFCFVLFFLSNKGMVSV